MIGLKLYPTNSFFLSRLFDNEGLGFIPVERFRIILKEVDEDFTEDELDDIIFEVGWRR